MAQDPKTDQAVAGPAAGGLTPPYIPFKTLLNLIIRMEDGAPPRLDKSYLSSQAGGLHQPIMAAFKFFELIGLQNEVLPQLEALAAAGDARPARFADLIRKHYSWAHLDSANATQQMLDDAFREHGVAGSTLRKAVTFYLHASRYAGLQLSKNYKAPRGAGQNGSVPVVRTRKRGTRKPGDAKLIVHTPPSEASVLRAGEARTNKYFDLLVDLAAAHKEKGEVPKDILDRIERLLPGQEGGDAS